MSTKSRLFILGGLLLSLVAFAGQERDLYEWLWNKDRKASADALRVLGKELSEPGLVDVELLEKWAAFSKPFGLSVFMPSWFDFRKQPGRYWVEGTRYVIDSSDVSSAGWRLRCPFSDRGATGTGKFATIDWKGALIPASQPAVWFIGQRSVSQQPPEQDKLKETVVAISQGNGRLIPVDLSGKSGVAILPYGVQ